MLSKEKGMIDSDHNNNSRSDIGNKEDLTIIIMETNNSMNLMSCSEHFSEEDLVKM
jgi:hypothetical protein